MTDNRVYRVTLTSRNPTTGEPYFCNFETGHMTISSLTDALIRDGVVHGFRLWTRRPGREGPMEILKREEFALGKFGAAHIELVQIPLVDRPRD